MSFIHKEGLILALKKHAERDFSNSEVGELARAGIDYVCSLIEILPPADVVEWEWLEEYRNRLGFTFYINGFLHKAKDAYKAEK